VAGIVWVDWVLLALLALSTLLGVMRGMLLEVLSLMGWIAAYFAARWWSPEVSSYLPVGAPMSPLRLAAGFLVTFAIALLLWKLFSWLLHKIVRASALSATDRVLGAVFGLLRGLAIALVIATLVTLSPLARTPAWQASRGAAWLNSSVSALVPWLPASWGVPARF
jgi:membrane protein required for colicin V production